MRVNSSAIRVSMHCIINAHADLLAPRGPASRNGPVLIAAPLAHQQPLPCSCCGLLQSIMLGRLASATGLLGRAASQLCGSQAAASGLQHAAAGASLRLSQLLAAHGFATNSHDIFNVHKESVENNWNTEFDFTMDNYKRVRGRPSGEQAPAASACMSGLELLGLVGRWQQHAAGNVHSQAGALIDGGATMFSPAAAARAPMPRPACSALSAAPPPPHTCTRNQHLYCFYLCGCL